MVRKDFADRTSIKTGRQTPPPLPNTTVCPRQASPPKSTPPISTHKRSKRIHHIPNHIRCIRIILLRVDVDVHASSVLPVGMIDHSVKIVLHDKYPSLSITEQQAALRRRSHSLCLRVVALFLRYLTHAPNILHLIPVHYLFPALDERQLVHGSYLPTYLPNRSCFGEIKYPAVLSESFNTWFH
jgi:hypothetical protein